ncbi:MAG: hypothetical protein V5A56_07410 [Halolamina sp.]
MRDDEPEFLIRPYLSFLDNYPFVRCPLIHFGRTRGFQPRATVD